MPSKAELPGHGSELNTKIAKARRTWWQQEKRIEKINKKNNHKENKPEFEKVNPDSFYLVKCFKGDNHYSLPAKIFAEGIKPSNADEATGANIENPLMILPTPPETSEKSISE